MSSGHPINRVAILGAGLIGGSFALALKKYTQGMHISAWDRPEAAARAKELGAADAVFSGELRAAIYDADLIYVALPIGTTLDGLPEIARHAAAHALVTDACSTKVRITQAAEEVFPVSGSALFVGGHPMAGKESGGIANGDADVFCDTTHGVIGGAEGCNEDPKAISTAEEPAMRTPVARRNATEGAVGSRVSA